MPPAPAPIDETLANMPMRNVGPRQPQQLSLFKRGQAPRPSGVERLQRGQAPRVNAFPGEATQPANLREQMAWESREGGQLQMFSPTTEEGVRGWKPTVAALKGAGKRRLTKAVPAGTGVKQAPPTGKKVTPQDIAAARAKAEEKAGPKRGLKKQAGVAKVEKANAVQERSPAKVDAREQAPTGKGMGGENAPVKTAGAGAELRRGKAAQETGEPDRKEAIVRQNVKPPKEGTPVPKTEAAAAVSAAAAAPAAEAKAQTSAAKPAGPVAISVELADGQIMRLPDGKAMLDKLDRDIEKFERFLACLMGK